MYAAEIILTGVPHSPTARGRNGWFNPARATVTLGNRPDPERPDAFSREVRFSAESQRGFTDMPPIHMALTPGEAEAVGRAMLDAAYQARREQD